MSDAPEQPKAPEATPVATESAPAPTPEAPILGTAYDQVQKLKADGVSREEIIEKMKAAGHDDESAKVLVNSVMGAMPSDLPSAQLSPGTNALAPSVFALSDIGLTGPSHVVGLYWMGFGAAILIALALASLMTSAGFGKLPTGVAYYGVRLGGVFSMAFIGYGIFRYSQAVVIRRKP
ncbi:MAG: hypothetical protein QM817_33860 [Archangium sp.]